MNSEFPETRFYRVTRRFGWFFSPLLLIALITFTLFIAEGLRFDLKSGSVEKKGSIEIKALKNGIISINGNERARTPSVIDFTSTSPVELKVTKDGRHDWKKTVTPRRGFVKTYYPILYPKDMKFDDGEIAASNVYKKDDANFFFYEKRDDKNVLIYRYQIGKQIFGIQERNDLYGNITNLVKENPKPDEDSSQSTFKAYSFLPSNSGKNTLLVVPGERAYLLDERGNPTGLANIIPKENDYFAWSPTDSHIVYKTGEELYTIDIASNRLLVVHKPQSSDETTEVQFIVESGIVYKIENANISDLVQNSFEGNNLQRIEIPNIDNIRKKNLVRAYNMLDKQGVILIQTKENIFEYNLSSFELTKFNRFPGEEIIFVDPERQFVVTTNVTNLNQFRFYDLDQKESKSFILSGEDLKSKPDQVLGFNGSQNIILRYGNALTVMDIDGSNEFTYREFTDAELILATKIDNQIVFIVRDKASSKTTQSPPPPIPTDPDADNSVTSMMKDLEYILRFERFEN